MKNFRIKEGKSKSSNRFIISKPAIACSKLTVETLGQGVKDV